MPLRVSQSKMNLYAQIGPIYSQGNTRYKEDKLAENWQLISFMANSRKHSTIYQLMLHDSLKQTSAVDKHRKMP